MGRSSAVIFFGPFLFSRHGLCPLIAMGADTGAKQLNTRSNKNMRSIVTTLSTLIFLGASGMASAQDKAGPVATLEKLEGTVMVDRGTGYTTQKGVVQLNEGDSVITLKDSAAEIVFRDGCRAQLKANNMMSISLNPGCKAPIVAVNPPAAVGAGAAGAAGASSWAVPVLAGAGVVALIAAGGSDDDNPISGE
jgi:hypothetical protein